MHLTMIRNNRSIGGMCRNKKRKLTYANIQNTKEYFEAFLRKYSTATRKGGCGAIIKVDPTEWYMVITAIDGIEDNSVLNCR